MVRQKRRSGRLNPAGSPEPEVNDEPMAASQDGPSSQPQPEPEPSAEQPDSAAKDDDDKCPACSEAESSTGSKSGRQEDWVRCDACKTWFHWRCAGKGELEQIDKWFCRPCLDEDTKRVITMKPPTRKSTRKRAQRDYAGLHSGQESDPNRWVRMLEGKDIKSDPFKRMKGSEVTMEWLEHDDAAMREPIVIPIADGLGMKMPAKSLTISDISEILGGDTPVEVIDVSTQSNSPGWTLEKWAEYYDTEPEKRDKIRNVISLEISGTELADKILPPRIVRELDWVEKYWPTTKKGRGHSYPKVQLYCLMGVKDAWTDWHVDFAGSSVYYHILHGAKVFYFIRPTPANLAAYERWSGTEMQNHSWLGDMCDDVYKVELTEGNTMIIPTGWIHAVYTPEDTLVFGGNFLHSYNVATQIKIREIEIATHVPKKFRFPFFTKLCWYAGEKYLRDLKAKEEFPPRILESVEALSEFLVSEVRIMERGSEASKKEVKDQVPGDRIKDAPAMARELRWRCKLAAGYGSDDDSSTRPKGKGGHHVVNGNATKRKRIHDDDEALVLFRNFRPKRWDKIVSRPTETEQVKTCLRRSIVDNDRQLETDWDLSAEPEVEDNADQVTVERSRTTMTRIRRTAQGFERQRIERVVESWAWDEGVVQHPPVTESHVNGEPEDVVMAEPQTDAKPSIPEGQGVEEVAVEDVKTE